MSDVEKQQVYSTVAAVLHLGNIGKFYPLQNHSRECQFGVVEFEETPEDTRGGCHVARAGEKSLVTASKLLEIDPEELRQALVSRVMQSARGGVKGTVIM